MFLLKISFARISISIENNNMIETTSLICEENVPMIKSRENLGDDANCRWMSQDMPNLQF